MTWGPSRIHTIVCWILLAGCVVACSKPDTLRLQQPSDYNGKHVTDVVVVSPPVGYRFFPDPSMTETQQDSQPAWEDYQDTAESPAAGIQRAFMGSLSKTDLFSFRLYPEVPDDVEYSCSKERVQLAPIRLENTARPPADWLLLIHVKDVGLVRYGRGLMMSWATRIDGCAYVIDASTQNVLAHGEFVGGDELPPDRTARGPAQRFTLTPARLQQFPQSLARTLIRAANDVAEALMEGKANGSEFATDPDPALEQQVGHALVASPATPATAAEKPAVDPGTRQAPEASPALTPPTQPAAEAATESPAPTP